MANDFCICWKKCSRQNYPIEKEKIEMDKATSSQPDLRRIPSTDKAFAPLTVRDELGIDIDPTERGGQTVSSGAKNYRDDLITDLTFNTHVKQS